jgi:hypothetical protein
MKGKRETLVYSTRKCVFLIRKIGYYFTNIKYINVDKITATQINLKLWPYLKKTG